jgi:GNAT superfamily N-acetyltransferase
MNVSYRPGTPEDSYAVFEIFERSLADLGRRIGMEGPFSADDPVALARIWEERRPLYAHLAATAEHFFVAQRGGRPIGFARSILRDGVRGLTEFFVLPGLQSGGVGRELLARAFPAHGAALRVIIASPDVRAQGLYMRMGVYPRCSVYYFWRVPERAVVESDLIMDAVEPGEEVLAATAAVDMAILSHRRLADHAWLMRNRQCVLYRRDGQVVGYGYVGLRNGPFALLEARDFPAALAHAESAAAAERRPHFGVEIPMVNRAAVDYLLGRGYRIDAFMATLMSDRPFGRLENYVVTSPPFFL